MIVYFSMMMFLSNISLLTVALFIYGISGASVSEAFLKTLRSPRPFHAHNSPARNRTCIVESHNNKSLDDSSYISNAIHDCNGGGHVIFTKAQSYVIGKPLNMSDLSHIDLDIQGKITFTDNLTYWQINAFDLDYQNSTSFFLLGGEDVNVYGGGVLDGNGQPWWDLYAKNKKIRRPVLFATVGLHNGSISDITMQNSPFWHNIVANSTHVIFTGISLYSTSNNENFEKNTDGWDTYRSDYITIQNSTVTNGDGMFPLSPSF